MAALPPAGDGMPGGFRWLLRDTTSLTKIQRAFTVEKSFADVLVDTAPTVILVVDADGRNLRTNHYLTSVSLYPTDLLIGQVWRAALIAEADRSAARFAMMRALAGGDKEGGAFPLAAREGRGRMVVWSAMCTRGLEGQPAVLIIGQDVSELEEAQMVDLHTARLAAIGQTMAGLAHEGRNALQRTHGLLARLEWSLLGRPEELDLVLRAQQAQDDLRRLFDDVQGYAAPIHLDWGRCDLVEVWRAAWASLAARLNGRAIELRESVETNPHCTADVFRLQQVFRNILENALDACTNPARIQVCCHEVAAEGQAEVRVSIRDNGPGLTPEQRRNIFEPFFATKVKGTGLGMAIAKRTIEAHGGRIDVGGTQGPGTEIVLILPRNRT